MNCENGTKNKPKILIICNYFLPGYKAGGGLRTIVHTVERFKDKFDFRIVCLNHDGDKVPYDSVRKNEWNDVDGSQVFYLPEDKTNSLKLRELVAEVSPQLIYLNSVFSVLSISLLILRKLKLISRIPIVLAPEGELSDGALLLKAAKKKAFIKFAKGTGLYKNLIWKVTAEPEKLEAERFIGLGNEIFIAPNLPSKQIFTEYNQKLKPPKKVGETKMIFLSRYARKKNFKWLVDKLEEVTGKLDIDIYGPLEDEVYWNETQQSISNLPLNIKVNYKGLVPHKEVLPTIFKYDFFILPTLGENFGHVFVEALAAGCPLIISDRTPWDNLEEKTIGWNLPLENSSQWNKVINFCIDLDNVTYTEMSTKARLFAIEWLNDKKVEESTLTILKYGLSSTLTN